MKINFSNVSDATDQQLVEHAQWLLKDFPEFSNIELPVRQPPDGYQSYVCIDVMGKQFVWLNENFPREQYTWYLWFESVFLVTPEMATFFRLRWS